MNTATANPLETGIGLGKAMAAALLGVVAFHVSYAVPQLAFLMLFYLAGMTALSLTKTRRKAFYPMLLVGLAVYAPQLQFFWTIFGAPALFLWLVLAFWLAMFSVIAWFVRTRLGVRWWLVSLPILWTGLEYFRSECYYLRFSWLNAGYAFSDSPKADWIFWPGMYGLGFVLMSLVVLTIGTPPKKRWITGGVAVLLVAVLSNLPSGGHADQRGTVLKVAGIQAEFPDEEYVPVLLDKVVAKFPDADVLVMSEYTFLRPVPQPIRDWCRAHGKFLVVGGKEPVGDDFYNTAFVVDPSGDIVFKQVKSVPIQFFSDGLPAPEQKVWESPWGPLVIPTCYDLSYTRVIDRMAALDAVGILNPTMDLADWGAQQHAMHARVPKVRAAEHRIPIFRIASSGISQLVDGRGITRTSAPFPGDEAIIGGEMILAGPARMPMDRLLGPACAVIAALFLAVAILPFGKRPGTTPDPSHNS